MPKADEIMQHFATCAGSYDQKVLEDKDYTAFEKIPQWIVDGLQNRSVKALDLGCGTGLSSLKFFKQGYQVTGIDLTFEMIEKAKLLPFERLYCRSLEGILPFLENEFDVAILLGVMEFIHEPKKLFQEVKRVLKEKGLFGLTLPIKMSKEQEKKLEIFTYVPEKMEKIFQNLGFCIQHVEKFQGFIYEGETVQYVGYLLQKI